MQVPNYVGWDDWRVEIGRKIRDLRTARQWSQAELAARLHLSQARLSQLERGNGSFSAEQLLEVLRLFNVDVVHFAREAQTGPGRDPRTDQLQNALARLGAAHLLESDAILPSERLSEVNAVVREVLVDPRSSRLLTGLAPVLVVRAEHVRLAVLDDQLTRLGLHHRLGWVVDNTCRALEDLAARRGTPRSALQRRRRAAALLGPWLRAAKERTPREPDIDILDPSIRSDETAAEVMRAGSSESRFWGVVSPLMPSDFANAIEAADAPH